MNFSRYNIDVGSVMEDLFIGPQAEVLEQINIFNTRYAGSEENRIGITPKFRWKPGSYDKVKAICEQHWLEWHKRPSGMASIFDRRRDYHRNNLRTALMDIDTTLWRFRNEGIEFLTDTNEITGKFNDFTEICLESFSQFKETYPESTLTVENMEVNGVPNDFRRHQLSLNVFIEDVKINVSVGNNEEQRPIGIIPFGNISLNITIPLVKLFNSTYNKLSELDSVWIANRAIKNQTKINATILPKYKGTYHPFISRSNRYWGGSRGNICLGNLESDVLDSFGVIKWPILGIHLSNWLETYKVNITHPLNTINYAIIGKPKYLNDDFYDIVDVRSTSDCFTAQLAANDDNPDFVIKQCDETECLLRKTCRDYKYNTVIVKNNELMANYMQEISANVVDLLPNEQEPDNVCTLFKYKVLDYIDEQSLNVHRSDCNLLFRNKCGHIVMKYLSYAYDNDFISIAGDNGSEHIECILDLMEKETHDEVVSLLLKVFPLFNEGLSDGLTDEQASMIEWVQELSRRT